MNEQCDRFFKTSMQFRKLKIGSILPIRHSEFGTLKTINCCKKNAQDGAGKVKVSDITEIMHAGSTAVSRTLKCLEENGYIERTVNKDDRRVTYVDITEAGYKILEETEAILDEYVEAVIGTLGTQDMDRLCDYLNKLYDVASQELDIRKKKMKTDNYPNKGKGREKEKDKGKEKEKGE